MNQPSSYQMQDQGLFTFYMSTSNQQQTQDYINLSEAAENSKMISSANGRKNSNHHCNDIKNNKNAQNLLEEQNRQKKLNKFLSNCLGAGRRVKNFQNPHLKQECQNTSQKQCSVGKNNQQAYINQNELFQRNQNKKSQRNHHFPESIINTKDQFIVNHNKNNAQVAQKTQTKQDSKLQKFINYKQGGINKLMKSLSTQSKKASKSNSTKKRQNQILLPAKVKIRPQDIQIIEINNKKIDYLKDNTKNNLIKKQQKLKLSLDGQNVLNKNKPEFVSIQSKDVSKKNKENNIYELSNKQLKLLNDFYPRIAKHHSQKIPFQTNINESINITSILTQQIRDCVSNINRKQNIYHNLVRLICNPNTKNKVNCNQIVSSAQKYSKKLSKKQSEPVLGVKTKKKENINVNSKKLQQKPNDLPELYPKIILAKTTPIPNTQSPKNIYMSDICSQIYKHHEKRKNRLLFIYKNGKSSLPPLKFNTQNIEQQVKISQVYFSSDHRQKKAPQINMGVHANDRIIEGWEERKKALLQKINQSNQSNKKQYRSKRDNNKDSKNQNVQGKKQKNKLYIKSANEKQFKKQNQSGTTIKYRS